MLLKINLNFGTFTTVHFPSRSQLDFVIYHLSVLLSNRKLSKLSTFTNLPIWLIDITGPQKTTVKKSLLMFINFLRRSERSDVRRIMIGSPMYRFFFDHRCLSVGVLHPSFWICQITTFGKIFLSPICLLENFIIEIFWLSCYYFYNCKMFVLNCFKFLSQVISMFYRVFYRFALNDALSNSNYFKFRLTFSEINKAETL